MEQPSLVDRAKSWARAIKRDVLVLWLAARDPRVPWYAKAVAALVAAYALSPIDLIPDFIPVLGYLDDLIIVPLGIVLALKVMPPHLIDDLRAKAAEMEGKPRSTAGMIAILAVWVAAVVLVAWFAWPWVMRRG